MSKYTGRGKTSAANAGPDPHEDLKRCGGCYRDEHAGYLRADLYIDDTGGNDRGSYRPVLAFFNRCSCRTRVAAPPAGWRYAEPSEVAPAAMAGVDLVPRPYLKPCTRCRGRLCPVFYWEPGLNRGAGAWVYITDKCNCRPGQLAAPEPTPEPVEILTPVADEEAPVTDAQWDQLAGQTGTVITPTDGTV